jgi:hypothetical protein
MKSIQIIDGYIVILNSVKNDTENLIVHFRNTEDAKKFMNTLLDLLKKMKFKISEIKKLEDASLSYNSPLRKNYKEICRWYDMPTFTSNSKRISYPFLKLSFSQKLFDRLEDLTKVNFTTKRSFIWFPDFPNDYTLYKNKVFITPKINPKYPIYIISKGRWRLRYTSRFLDFCDIDYKIVVEPQEYDNYASEIDKAKILTLPKKYLNKKSGSIPARNFVLQHAKQSKSIRHWILDDNIMGYYRLFNNERILCKSGCVFRIIEDYVDRYENIKLAGHNYYMFAISNNLLPITFNTRIYSSILLSNDIPFKWRGKYNEDTDLSLRILKKGYATVLFNCILAQKQTTMLQEGGNTDTIYKSKKAHYLKAKSLQKQHPDVTTIAKRFNRIHHIVDYSSFKDIELIPKPNLRLTNKSNNYGMKLVKKENWRE